MKAARKDETRGVRPRPDQIDKLASLQQIDPELTWSSAIRRGLDLFFAEVAETMRQQPEALPPPNVFRAINFPVTGNTHPAQRSAQSRTSSANRKSRKAGHAVAAQK